MVFNPLRHTTPLNLTAQQSVVVHGFPSVPTVQASASCACQQQHPITVHPFIFLASHPQQPQILQAEEDRREEDVQRLLLTPAATVFTLAGDYAGAGGWPSLLLAPGELTPHTVAQFRSGAALRRAASAESDFAFNDRRKWPGSTSAARAHGGAGAPPSAAAVVYAHVQQAVPRGGSGSAAGEEAAAAAARQRSYGTAGLGSVSGGVASGASAHRIAVRNAAAVAAAVAAAASQAGQEDLPELGTGDGGAALQGSGTFGSSGSLQGGGNTISIAEGGVEASLSLGAWLAQVGSQTSISSQSKAATAGAPSGAGTGAGDANAQQPPGGGLPSRSQPIHMPAAAAGAGAAAPVDVVGDLRGLRGVGLDPVLGMQSASAPPGRLAVSTSQEDLLALQQLEGGYGQQLPGTSPQRSPNRSPRKVKLNPVVTHLQPQPQQSEQQQQPGEQQQQQEQGQNQQAGSVKGASLRTTPRGAGTEASPFSEVCGSTCEAASPGGATSVTAEEESVGRVTMDVLRGGWVYCVSGISFGVG